MWPTLQHVYSGGQGTIVYKSCATHLAFITCSICLEYLSRHICVPQGMNVQLSEVWQSINGIYFLFILLAEAFNRRRKGGNRSIQRKLLMTSFRKCHILKPQNPSPSGDLNPCCSIGGRLGKADVLTISLCVVPLYNCIIPLAYAVYMCWLNWLIWLVLFCSDAGGARETAGTAAALARPKRTDPDGESSHFFPLAVCWCFLWFFPMENSFDWISLLTEDRMWLPIRLISYLLYKNFTDMVTPKVLAVIRWRRRISSTFSFLCASLFPVIVSPVFCSSVSVKESSIHSPDSGIPCDK